jgi:hypothetical protein
MKNRIIELRTQIDDETSDHSSHPFRTRFAIALAVATVSDLLSLGAEFVPPVQWAVDLATASLLFLILGRRWAILPGLIAEAIPGLAAFPFWVLVVLSIILYDQTGRKSYAAI